jgi:NAD(P)-dependent dehydrogenase (short-subunit alcohol dehydrogenase family)
MDVNVFGQVRLVKAFLPLLRRCKESRIVNVESLAGIHLLLNPKLTY